MNPIQYLMSQISMLHNETAILEACDWDDEKVDMLVENLNNILIDLDSSLTENLKRFCDGQEYISEYNREQLFSLLEQSLLTGIKEQARLDEEYEN